MSDVFHISRAPCSALKGLVARFSGYSATSEPSRFLETAELVFPIVINLGRPWSIRLGQEDEGVERTSFTAGLFPGPVAVTCERGAELLQVDLTPFGAVRLFGEAAAEMAAKVIDMKDIGLLGRHHDAIHDELYCTTDWSTRFDIVERYLTPLFRRPSSVRIQHAWHLLARGATVAETAANVGWSTRYLSARFQKETGIRPVTAARMLRFQRARTIALKTEGPDWAAIASDVGYADQAHMIRAFHEFAGATPAAWAQRTMPSAPRLQL